MIHKNIIYSLKYTFYNILKYFLRKIDKRSGQVTKILVTWCEQLTHWKNPWSCRRLRVGGEEGIREWDGWTASLIQWTWSWVIFGRWWGTGRPGMLQSMGCKVRHDWVTEQQDNRSNMHAISKLLNIHHILDKGSFVSR